MNEYVLIDLSYDYKAEFNRLINQSILGLNIFEKYITDEKKPMLVEIEYY